MCKRESLYIIHVLKSVERVSVLLVCFQVVTILARTVVLVVVPRSVSNVAEGSS